MTARQKLINLLIVFIVGAVGFWLGPEDLQPGDYAARIDLDLDGQPFSLQFPFLIAEEQGDPKVVTEPADGYQVTVQGHEAYAYQLGQSINYQVQVTDADGDLLGLSLESATSTLTGLSYQQSVPPTGHSDGALTFSMRIPFKAKITTALLFAVATLWLVEIVPLSVGGLLIPIVVVVFRVAEPKVVLQPFFHPIIVLFFAGFLLAEGMRRTGVDRWIALNILRRSSLKPAYLMLTMMMLTAFLSLWMSNTASVAIIIPIALAVLARIPGEEGRTGFRRALILGVAYAASMGGIGSAIGTPANILAMDFLNEYAGANLAFIDWFAYGLPIAILMVPIIWLFLILTFRVRTSSVQQHLSHQVYKQELKAMGRPDKAQRYVLVIFVIIMGLLLTERWHQVHASIVALGGVLFLFFVDVIKKDDLNNINWDALLTFGGGLAIGNILVATGVSDWIALHLTALSQLPSMLIILLVASLTLLIGAFISNTACAAMLIPLAIPLANLLHIDPRLLVGVVAIASSIDFALVVGTPPTMMAYSTGYFDVKEIFQRGILLDAIGVLVLSLLVTQIWGLLGVVSL